jgi:hypothetical protein
MSDNPLIEGFLKLHEAGGIGGGMSGTKFSNAANYAPPVGAGVRGAFNNFTMGAGPYGRAAVDYSVKNLGSLARVSEPTTFYKELEQENEKDTAAKRDFPDAYKAGEIGSTAVQALGGAGAVTAVIKAGLKSATAKNTVNTIAKNADADDFELGMKNALDLTQKMRVPSKPLNLTPQMRVPKLRTEEENDSSKGNNEMSTNPFIKGFLKLQEKVGPRPGTGDAALIKPRESRTTAISNPVTDRTGNSSPSTTSYTPNTPAMNPRGAGGAGYSMNTGEPVKIEGPKENKPKVSNLPPSPANLKVSPDRDRQASPIAPVGTKTSNLTVGSSGDEVKRAQKALGITADGSYGPQTRQAVIDFQTKRGLKADGIIGDQTLSAMNRENELGESEMSTNPYIKGFFDIEEARAKNTNIFDESKKLTAAQKEELDKNNNGEIDAKDFEMLRKKESDLDEAKKAKPGHNAMVMARKISKVFKAKPDFLDIDKDGDEEEPMKKAAADKKKESDLDEAAKAQTLSALTGKASPIDDYAKMIAKFKAEGGRVTKVPPKLDDKEKAKLSATFKKTGGKGGSAMATGEFASMNNRDANYNAKQATRKKSMGMKEEVDLEEKAKWRSSSAAKKITDPNNPDLSLADYDYHYENPRSTGRLKSTADTELSYGSINNRRKSNISSIGKRKGMISKADINRVKSNAFNALKKEGVEFSEEEIDFINNVMEAMPVAPTSENDSPNPTPKKKAEGSRAKGSMAD